jgi:hypothetical protein
MVSASSEIPNLLHVSELQLWTLMSPFFNAGSVLCAQHTAIGLVVQIINMHHVLQKEDWKARHKQECGATSSGQPAASSAAAAVTASSSGAGGSSSSSSSSSSTAAASFATAGVDAEPSLMLPIGSTSPDKVQCHSVILHPTQQHHPHFAWAHSPSWFH